ncbi:Eco57I restriction-modification methylase domain-containing protein [Gemmata sp.]|uniref:Eco57I restriction-modification methylase domain-containing protein n=1 Tax=Gemmata sp. TaxID=1914242 RepID=UPI003F70DEF2
MPTEGKPLFHPAAIRAGLKGFQLSPAAGAARAKVREWATQLGSKKLDAKKETELLPNFIAHVFEAALGYAGAPADPHTLKREAFIEVDGKFADAGLGRFSTKGDTFVAVLEGKGPRDPLDRPFGSRKHSAVTQAALYALQMKIDWYLVTNLKETRLYYKRQDTAHYERFETAKLADSDDEYRRFVFLLGAERVAGAGGKNHLDSLFTESRTVGRELTVGFYREYRDLRRKTFHAIRDHNPGRDTRQLLAATQKILDRVLFVAFCEDRELLPAQIIERAYTHTDAFNPRPVWDSFKALFRSVDVGNPALKVDAYNGGLFAPDPFVDGLTVPDPVCEGFKKLADYEYGHDATDAAKLIDVEILGHIFEQSISDLEEMHREIASPATAAAPADAGPSKRKKEGAFYTPAFVTRYIVRETLGPVLGDRLGALRARHQAAAVKTAKTALEDPQTYDLDKLNQPQTDALIRFWEAWVDELQTVRLVDPSCGSGAFLIEAFEQLFAEYRDANARLTELRGGQPTLFDADQTILTKNLFGMDLNGEAVEIARLSCWIKTAAKGKKLTALDANIVQGNSVTAEPSPLEAWRTRFPDVFAAGGFDVVIANPPYVRQEWFSADKPYLQKHYKAYDGVADLYVYFYELGLNILRPGGRLGYIVTNKWMKAGYGEPLRKLYGEAAWVESVVDLGHNKQVFPDADVFPCILTARKPNTEPAPETVRVCILPREQTRVDDLSQQIADEGVAVPRSRLGAEPWNLEPPGIAALMEKLRAVGVPLKEFAGVGPLSGIKTGFNEAYLIDTPTKEKLVVADPRSAVLLKPYLRGQDNARWRAEWSGLWMIEMKSSGSHEWPWSKSVSDAEAEATFRETYPAIHGHLNQYRASLTSRQDQGEYWWELRSCAYWDAFDKRKLIYPEITWRADWNIDARGLLINNTVYILPTEDLWVLAVMNSPVVWAYCWRNAQHGKDEALRFIREFVQTVPIPNPTDDQRLAVEAAVGRLIELAGEQQAGCAAVLDWLRSEFGVEKPTQKLQSVAALDADAFAAEVKKAGKKGLGVADLKRLKDEHAKSVLPRRTLALEAEQLERQVSDVVNAAFGLTPAEVKLMWDTAPPRMPIARPAGQ